jgi:hypothetical protein
MKFVLEKGQQGVLETPLCLPYTRGGAVPHLVQSVYEDLSPRPLAAMLSLPSLYELPGTAVLKEYKHGIHKFLHLKDHFLYLSIQDPHCPPRIGYNEEKSTSVWTNGGRIKVPVAGYMEFVKASRPDVFECLCDSVSSETNKLKRIRKSVDRTLHFLDETLSIKQDSRVIFIISSLSSSCGCRLWMGVGLWGPLWGEMCWRRERDQPLRQQRDLWTVSSLRGLTWSTVLSVSSQFSSLPLSCCPSIHRDIPTASTPQLKSSQRWRVE